MPTASPYAEFEALIAQAESRSGRPRMTTHEAMTYFRKVGDPSTADRMRELLAELATEALATNARV